MPTIVKLSDEMSGPNFILRTDEAREKCIKNLKERLQQYRRQKHASFAEDTLEILIQKLKDAEKSF